MEYRRKRKTASRRRASSHSAARRNSASAGGAGRAIVSLLMVGGIVYLVSASAAGTWIAENVMAPMISAFSGNNDADNDGTQDATNTQTPDGSLSTSVDLSAGASSQSVTSAQVSLPALDCYMLQMGVYSSKSNAEAQAETLQTQGAGGYILEDASTGETRYRVMASGYEDAESAKSVKNRLVDEGIDCTVYELSTAAATFRVTASEESIPQIEAGFAALEKAQRALSTAAIDFDKNSMSVEEGQSLALEILSTLESDMGGLLSFDGTKPRFGKNAKRQAIEPQELTIYYSSQCPYIHQSVELVRKTCEELKAPCTLIPVDTLEKAKALPCVFNNWAVFYGRKFVTVNLLDAATLKRFLKQ